MPIETIRVGQRVLTDGDLDAVRETAVDPVTWRRLKLEATHTWDDGTEDVYEVESLQPREWLVANRAEVGADVPMPVDLAEMGVPDGLRARVIADEACPMPQNGRGRVVMNSITHSNSYVVDLSVRGDQGRGEAIRTTAFHKFWSESRREWVSAHDLRPGESLLGVNGAVRVVGLARVPGVHRVYNLTVEGEHVYRVSYLGVLVHNDGCNLASPDRTTHILDGDATGGGHAWPGQPGKTPFPEDWSREKIMDSISDVATDQGIHELAPGNGGREVVGKGCEGVKIRVILDPANRGVEL